MTKEKINGAVAHFEEKGLSEMPFVENRYKELQDSKGEETARAFLTGYTADFAGATILRWQEMADAVLDRCSRGDSEQLTDIHIIDNELLFKTR